MNYFDGYVGGYFFIFPWFIYLFILWTFFWLILYLLYIVSKEISIKFTLYILSLYHEWYMFMNCPFFPFSFLCSILISEIYRIFLVFFFFFSPYFYHLAFTIVSHAYTIRGTPKLYYDYWWTFHFIIYTIYQLCFKINLFMC